MKVGIIGMGVVGEGQAEMFSGHDLVTYDALWDMDYPYGDLVNCDFALICVGTPQAPGGRAYLGHVKEAIGSLPPNVPVVLRSTVPPGTTDSLLAEYAMVGPSSTHFFHGDHGRLYVHAPEFMGENVLHSWQHPVDVPYMILGGSAESTLFFHQKFAQVFPGEIITCSAKEAELAKYAANLYWATRVTFVNEFANICEHFGVDYERMREAWLADPRMTEFYTQYAGYPPGFGGRCWPKDLSALVAASADAGYDAGFLRAIEEANERYQNA